jgi:curved DNA-binding protein
MVDYYEFLQISPNADAETIHRVYRFLAARFHPDNQNSGSSDMFGQLKAAYDVLSNPALRSEYDMMRRQKPQQPLSATIDFMDNLDGELNRRLAVLAMLYYRRRRSPYSPEVSLAELEERM